MSSSCVSINVMSVVLALCYE